METSKKDYTQFDISYGQVAFDAYRRKANDARHWHELAEHEQHGFIEAAGSAIDTFAAAARI